MAAHSSDQIPRPGQVASLSSRSASFDQCTRSEDSWVEISSQPSSSSLSSIGEDHNTTSLRRQNDPRSRRRRSLRQNRPTTLNISHRPVSTGGVSSQEEYEESDSEPDRVMTSSGEGPPMHADIFNTSSPAVQSDVDNVPQASDEDDENRTAINYPLHNDQCFTPQPNAFSHPSTGQMRHGSQPAPGSYFPAQRPSARPAARQSFPAHQSAGPSSHMPQNILSPSYNPAEKHEEALRTSLNTLLSCAAAARGIPKSENKRPTTVTQPPRGNRIEPMTFRLVPESELPATSPPQFQEPTFKPTIRRESISTSTSSERLKDTKRKARNSSRERRALKKVRHASSSEDLHISPTLLTWVVSAGVVVVISALTFSAGYSMGKEAGRLEASALTDEQIRSCAREAGRSGLGLKRSLARSAVTV